MPACTNMTRNWLTPTLLLVLYFIFALPSYAASHILTVKGKVGTGEQHYTYKQLKSLPNIKIETETIWTDSTHTYTAISVKTLLETVKAKGKTLKLIALNDYSVDVPVETLVKHNAFIAFEQDGKKMRIRNKGPLWLLYPFSDNPEINIPVYQSHSVWQLKTIEVF